MRRILILLAVVWFFWQPALQAQEKGPIVMRIVVEWTTAGMLGGAAVGALLWLTDPGNETNNLSERILVGAGGGGVIGAIYGLSVLSEATYYTAKNMRTGQTFANLSPLHPTNRISADPISIELNRMDILSQIRTTKGSIARRFQWPVLNLRF